MAAELLVPLDVLRRELDFLAGLEGEVSRLAHRFKVSTLVVLGHIPDAGGPLGGLRRGTRPLAQSVEGSRGSICLPLGARVGKRFARALVESTFEGRTGFTEPFGMLGVKKMETFIELGRKLGVGY